MPIQISIIFTFFHFAMATYLTLLIYGIIPNENFSTSKLSWINSKIEEQVCEYEGINFEQKRYDAEMIKLKRELFDEILAFQNKWFGRETLAELMSMKSKWDLRGLNKPKITVILNHFKRKTLCSQLDAFLQQSLPFHQVWVLSFGSPEEESFRRIVSTYNDSRISFISSSGYDFKYFGRFQLALQTGTDFVYVIDDDMIPGKRMLEILSHVAGTEKYRKSILGSIGRILPFKEKDSGFPSYQKRWSKEAGIYLPDPANEIVVERIMQVDFLSSSWFLSSELVKALFIESPFTFTTGEDLHLSYQLQKYRNVSTFVVPVDPSNQETWGDSEHRLAYISQSTSIFKHIVKMRDEQWWRALSGGYVTQWAAMYPQKIDALFYAHTIDEVKALAPLLVKFRSSTDEKEAYLVVPGGQFCPCEDAATALNWPVSLCKERRFSIIDMGIDTPWGFSDLALFEAVNAGMRGLMRIHNPTLLIALSETDPAVKKALEAAAKSSSRGSTLVLLPSSSVSKVLWMPQLRSSSLSNWKKMRISINIITQNRAQSLVRLLKSLNNAYYTGDEIAITFSMDNQVDEQTLRIVNDFDWPHGPKILKRRIIQGGLIRAVIESWYPSDDDDFGLLLEDDIEVSPYYYLWIKYTLLAYYYDPQVDLPQLSSISLYTPRLVEVIYERPQWNATDYFKHIHPNTPYLHQLPCSWGSVFFPKHWREFYTYMTMRFNEDPKLNPVQIPGSRTNNWQKSWKRFMIDMMYLRGYVALYPNFPNQASFSTNHMEPGVHIGAKDNYVTHNKEDYEVPLLDEDFWHLLPNGKLPLSTRLPSLNLFNEAASLEELKAAGAKLGMDVVGCKVTELVIVDKVTGFPDGCAKH